MNSLIRKILYSATKKHIDESKLKVIDINLNEADVSYFFLSTNTIASFTFNGQLYYFRECPEILPLKEYFINSTDKFFYYLDKFGISKEHFSQKIPIRTNFSTKEVSAFKKYIAVMLRDKKTLSLIADADIIAEKARFSIWEKADYNIDFFNKFGFEAISADLYDIALCYLWYIRATASSYKTLKIIRGKKYSYFSAVKAVASKTVAEELNLSNMITDVTWCRLKVGTGRSFGILSSSAPGSRMVDMNVDVSPVLQRELNLLNALDVVCFQKDHGPNNYNINSDFKVCAFDNDNPSTFMPIPFAFMSMSGCSQLIDIKGNMLRPYFDKQLSERLNNLNIKVFKSKLKPYLNSLQINATVFRIKMLKTAIKREINKNSNFLLEANEWSKETVEEELSGKYGVTYLVKSRNC